jgi:hypothetical protein
MVILSNVTINANADGGHGVMATGGGKVVLTADGQTLTGDMTADDSISPPY